MLVDGADETKLTEQLIEKLKECNEDMKTQLEYFKHGLT